MTLKDQILSSIAREVRILTFLSKRVTAENVDTRLIEGTRSIQELLQYLTWCGVVPTHYYIQEEVSLKDSYQLYQDKYAAYDWTQFRTALYEQFADLQALFTKIEDKDLQNRMVKMPWGEDMQMGEALLHTTVKYLATYRMHLFLALKMAGETDLDTIDCWIGRAEEVESGVGTHQ